MSSKSPVVPIRMPHDLHARFEARALRNGTGISAEIREAADRGSYDDEAQLAEYLMSGAGYGVGMTLVCKVRADDAGNVHVQAEVIAAEADDRSVYGASTAAPL